MKKISNQTFLTYKNNLKKYDVDNILIWVLINEDKPYAEQLKPYALIGHNAFVFITITYNASLNRKQFIKVLHEIQNQDCSYYPICLTNDEDIINDLYHPLMFVGEQSNINRMINQEAYFVSNYSEIMQMLEFNQQCKNNNIKIGDI